MFRVFTGTSSEKSAKECQPFSFSKFVTVAQLPTLVHVINRSRSGGDLHTKKAGELVVPLRD